MPVGRSASFNFSTALLGSTSSQLRACGMVLLRLHIARSSETLSPASLGAYLDRLADFGRVQALRVEASSRRAGVGILASLAEIDDQQSVERRIGVLNFLRDVLEVDRSISFSPSCAQAVATALGSLSNTVVLNAELQLVKERYFVTSLEWLGDTRYEGRRYAAALLLSQLISNLPTLALVARGCIHVRIWDALADQSSRIREVVACAVGSFLCTLFSRSDSLDASIYFQYAAVIISRGLLTRQASIIQVHAAILLLSTILQQHSCIGKSRSGIINSDNIAPGRYWHRPLLRDETLLAWFKVLLGVRGIHAPDMLVHLASLAVLPSLASFMAPLLNTPLAVQAIAATLQLKRSTNFAAAISHCSFVIVEILDKFAMNAFIDDIIELMADVICHHLESHKHEQFLDLRIIRSFTVLVRSVGRYDFQHPSQISRVGDSLYSQARRILNFLVPHSLTRSVFHLVSAIYAYCPSLRPAIKQYVLDQLASILVGICVPTSSSRANRHALDGPHSETQSIFADYDRSFNYFPILYSLRRSKLHASMSDDAIIPCLVAHPISKIRFAMGICSELSLFEDEHTHSALTLLMETIRVLFTCVITPAPVVSLEAAIAIWKCLEQIPYLDGCFHVVLGRLVPSAFLHSVVERVVLVAVLHRGEACGIILKTLPPFCDTVIIKAPRLLRLILNLCRDETFLIQRAALQIISRLLRESPWLILPKVGQFLARLLATLNYHPLISFNAVNSLPHMYHKRSVFEPTLFSCSEPVTGNLKTLQLLGMVVEAGCEQLAPYIPTTFRCVAQILARTSVNDATAPVAASIVGQLTLICPDTVLPIINKIIPKVVCVLSARPAHAPKLRYIAARSLERLVSATGNVLTPYYLSAPGLIDTLLDMLKDKEFNQDIQAIRTLGAVGALDPPLISVLEKGAHQTWRKNEVSSLLSTSEALATLDLFHTSGLFRNHLEKDLTGSVVKSPLVNSKIGKGIHLGELFQASASVTLLDSATKMPQFRKEALSALNQISCWFAPDALPLHATLKRLLCIMSAHAKPASVVGIDESAPPRQSDSLDIYSIQMLTCNLIRILQLVEPYFILTECHSGQFAAAISALWSMTGSALPIAGESIIGMLSCLHSRLSLHTFASQMRWLLPPLRYYLMRGALYPVLHVIDCISDALIVSGDAKEITVTILNVLQSLLSSKCEGLGIWGKHGGNTKAFATGICLLIVSAIRLVNRLYWPSTRCDIAPHFIKCMLGCINRVRESGSSVGSFKGCDLDKFSKGPFRKDAIHPPRRITNHHMIVASEFAVHGLAFVARELGNCVVPNLRNVQHDLGEWAKVMEQTLTDAASPAVDAIFRHSDENALAAVAIHAALAAYKSYVADLSTLARTQVLPAPTEGYANILAEDYDHLFADLAILKPLHPRQMTLTHCRSKFGPLESQGQHQPVFGVHENGSTLSTPWMMETDYIIDLAAFRQTCDNAGFVTDSDWVDWMHRVSVEMLRQSPSPYLRPCSTVAEVYHAAACDLFKPGFLAMWIGCGFTAEDCFSGPIGPARQLVKSLSTAICSCSLPQQYLSLLFELTDFTRLHRAPIPIDLPMLAQRAFQRHAPARALAVREIQLRFGSDTDIHSLIDATGALVTLNNNLGLMEAATGTLVASGLVLGPHSKLDEQLDEQLGYWGRALAMYKRDSNSLPHVSSLNALNQIEIARDSEHLQDAAVSISSRAARLDAEIGQLRCCSALFEYQSVLNRARHLWTLLTSSFHTFPCESTSTSRMVDEQNHSTVCVDANSAIKQEYRERLMDVAVLGARASWVMQSWDELGSYVAYWDASRAKGYAVQEILGICRRKPKFEISTHELFVFQAVLVWKSLDYEVSSEKSIRRTFSALSQARTLVQAARVQLVENTRLCIQKGHNHAYYCVLSAQQLCEFEEAIKFELQAVLDLRRCHQCVGTAKVFLKLLAKWKRRERWWGGHDAGARLNALLVHKLVLRPDQDIEAYIGLIDLCHDSGNFLRCGNILVFLDSLPITPSSGPFSNVSVALRVCCLLWTVGRQVLAYDMLSRLTEYLIFNHQGPAGNPGDEILISAVLTRSKWSGVLAHASENKPKSKQSDSSRTMVIGLLKQVTMLVPSQPRVWHSWALINHEVCDQLERRNLHKAESSSVIQANKLTKLFLEHTVESIRGFFRSLELIGADWGANSDAVVLQHTLRLLTMWFKHGACEDVNTSVREGLAITSVNVWLGVLPQLIARVDHPNRAIRQLVASLLVEVGRAHPQALICPITVSAQAASESRRIASIGILDSLQNREYYAQTDFNNSEIQALVAEANLVSQELQRSAITWHEAWYQGIETAANIFFGENDIKATVISLIDMHRRWHNDLQNIMDASTNSIDHSASTKAAVCLAAFAHAYSSNLLAAESFLCRFCRSRSLADMHQAWDIYSLVHKWVKQNVLTNELSRLNLEHVAPALMSTCIKHVAVPSTNMLKRGRGPPVQIASFSPLVHILASKQRPRHLKIFGSDGREYHFLLKGHEDLRQDERVMQLFGLINALMANTNGSRHTGTGPLQVQQFVVMPLSNSSGLIEWVRNSSTIYQLILNYRSRFSIPIDIERHLMNSVAGNYHRCRLMQRVNDFKYVIHRTCSRDLTDTFCTISGDVAEWLVRRTRFARSLAVTSVVGYVLGLGDRHLSNMLVGDRSGQVIHIDFGDCFEVAMKREKFPEKIPFRLTKLLVNAMEVSGVEGSFRLTCNYTMKVLRADFHSLMAMLEAFVHDPLVDWKLLLASNVPQGSMLITDRIQRKLTGCIFQTSHVSLSPIHQVDCLLREARCAENLCQMYGGWCPYW